MLSEAAVWIASRMDGTRDVGDLQAEICRSTGEIVPRETVCDLIGRLDAAGFLDSPAFRERRAREEEAFCSAERRPAHFAGKAYEGDPGALAGWIDSLIAMGRNVSPGPGIRGLLAPHIDPRRGDVVYGSAYAAIKDSPSRRIVILGISHSGGEVPYATTAKDFETPFGDCPVDRDFLFRLHDGLPFDPLTRQVLHRKEHSIEFQAVFLRRLLGGWDARRIVPILCCFPWLPDGREDLLPYPPAWGAAFVERLASLIDGETLVVAGVDFAHVGRRFGDSAGGVARMREPVREADHAMMEAIASGSAAAFKETIDLEQDVRRICGYPAILTLLEILADARGTVLDYGQAVDESIDSLVSFGAMALR